MSEGTMIEDAIRPSTDVVFAPSALPGFSGGTEAAFLNTDLAAAPFVALLRPAPGATLAKHYHTEAVEAVYVLEGEMINDGERLAPGSMLAQGPAFGTGPTPPKPDAR